jgi:hypothetical protein
METPVFRLGLVGFSQREEQRLRSGISEYRHAHWRCGRPEGADAWLINGARMSQIVANRVRVVGADGPNTAAALLLDVSSRPVAIALPAPQQCQQLVAHIFDPNQAGRLSTCLATLDVGLARLRRVYRTASHLVEHNATVGKAIYELRAGAQVLAVADMKGTVFISPQAGETQFRQAAWHHRARKTVAVPTDFEKHPLAELLWAYSTRTRRDLLPARYRDSLVYLRRPPRVPSELVGDVHLRIIRALAEQPLRMPDLVDTIGADDTTLARSLAALYLVGSITTNPERAWASSERGALWSSRVGLLNDATPPSRQDQDGRPSTAPLF